VGFYLLVIEMKIGVISDTHLREPSKELERIAVAHFTDADMILHAGDFARKKDHRCFVL
jgi:predicted phosphodiesterase